MPSSGTGPSSSTDCSRMCALKFRIARFYAELTLRHDQMVAESAASYTIPRQHAGAGDAGEVEDGPLFSLERFIPLLSERIYVLSPHTRLHLTSWITVLDSVPELELVAYLPSFLDGLL